MPSDAFRYPLPLGSAFGSEKSNTLKAELMKSKSPRNQTISRTFGTPRGIRTPGLLVRRLSHAQIGVISAPICAFYHHSLGGLSIVSVQPCPLFSDSGSKLGHRRTEKQKRRNNRFYTINVDKRSKWSRSFSCPPYRNTATLPPFPNAAICHISLGSFAIITKSKSE